MKMMLTLYSLPTPKEGFFFSVLVFTLHVQRERDEVICVGVHMYVYVFIWTKFFFGIVLRDRLTFSNIRGRTC